MSVAKSFVSLDELKGGVRSLGINSWREYAHRYKEINGAPSFPDSVYKNRGWKGFDDLFGRDVEHRFVSLEELKKAVRALGITTQKDFQARHNEIHRAPADPSRTYRSKGWISWTDLFGVTKYKRHGDCAERDHTPEYVAWCAMRQRCYYPSHIHYKYYGGATPSVQVCEHWRESYENFLADMGRKPSPQHSLGRFGDIGNYEPGNCVWQTQKEQSAERAKKHDDECLRGHKRTLENTFVSNRDVRQCRVCLRISRKKCKERQLPQAA
jgi:hypothetical protein